ncbi:MAG: transcription termination/antitermination protein NusG, partial [SAR324 cluster bacterium]
MPDKKVEEQTGTEMVLEEQKETVETQGSTLLEQEETAPEVTEANTEVQDSAA